jgi:transposase
LLTARQKANAPQAEALLYNLPAEVVMAEFKRFPRVATRYEKAARNYLAMIALAATVLWIR